MKPKLIVLDLDGTLLNSKKQISERNLFALQKVKAEDINIIFATARPPRAVKCYRSGNSFFNIKRISWFYFRLLPIGRP